MEVLMVIIMVIIYILLDTADDESESTSCDFIKQKIR